MKNNEAIELLSALTFQYRNSDRQYCQLDKIDGYDFDALNLAIKALKENTKLRKENEKLKAEIARLKEKEVAINQKVIDRTIERLKENKVIGADCIGIGFECIPLFKAIEIVKEESKK